ncbi:MAG TPA: nuclear transport factor 2 family protein [Gemmatimonadaceae bacterium]|jgi:ketosteroid isomerase-like protein
MRLERLAFVIALAASPIAHAGAQTSRAARTLLRLEDQWASALVSRDSGFFRRTLHPDYVYSDERGTFSKAQVIAEQVGGTDTVTYAANEDMRAHVHGDAAVVTGILIVRGRGKGGRFEHRYRYTDTWVAGKQGWLMIASQDYEIPRR